MQDMAGFVIGIVIVSVTLVVGIYILATIQGTFTAGSAAANASADAVTALSGGTSWLTILVVVGFAVIVLVLLNKGLGGTAASAGNIY